MSLLGEDSVDFVYGGAGSGSVDTSLALNLKEAMEKSGFKVNEPLWKFYDTGAGKDYRKSVPDETGAGEFSVGEVPADVYTDDVKNTGDVAGKDVVEVYMQSPYTAYDRENGIEKSAVELVGFTKTDTIEPGKEQTVTVAVDKEVMKTYDAANAKTYVVDEGDYFFTAASDAHEAINNILAAKGYTTQNGMDADGNAKMTYKTSVDALDTATYADGSMTASDELLADLAWDRSDAVVNDGSKMPEFSKDGEQKVADAKDAAYDDPIWSELVSELSAEKAMQLVRQGGYATIQADMIGLPATTDKDGTSGISGTFVGGQSAMAYPVEAVMACTWNKDLMYEMGLSLGEDSIRTGVAGWYAPGVDIHRSPYSGRNFEYFSEDGYLSGQMAGNEVKGAREKGVITYMKHFALNDQETNRYGGAMFANEQSIRELYLKDFEYTVTIGKTNAAMAGMNRIGARWVGAHKGLMTNVLRGEWGFEGMVITDQASVSAMFYQDIISGLAAGTDLWLNTNKSFWALDSYAEEDGTVTDWTTNFLCPIWCRENVPAAISKKITNMRTYSQKTGTEIQ